MLNAYHWNIVSSGCLDTSEDTPPITSSPNVSPCNKSNCIFRKHSKLYVETCTTMIISMDYCRKCVWFIKKVDFTPRGSI